MKLIPTKESARHSMARIDGLKPGDELGGGLIKVIFKYNTFETAIVTETAKHWNIYLYLPDTTRTRVFKGFTYIDNLRTYAIVPKSNYDLLGLMQKLLIKLEKNDKLI